MESKPALLPIGPTARRLRVPVSWLRAEALAGRIPHLQAGPRLLFDVGTVERLLIERAKAKPQGVSDGH